jgi:Predicted hydrolases or acyltransferases (alpha/beta hydrolase superfamily)
VPPSPARRQAATIRSLPDPYPADVITTEPHGVTSFIERPDGTVIRAVTAGEGPTVVFAHGIYMSVIEWSVVWDILLERGYRVIAFDQRGHGQSTIGSEGICTEAMAGDYLAVLETYDVRGGILLAHSMGGFLAVAAVLDIPGVAERLGGLILMSTFAGDVLRGRSIVVARIKSGAMVKLAANDTTGTLFARSLCGDDPSPAMLDAFLEVFRATDHQSLLPILEALVDEDRGDRLGDIALPTIVLCGEKDTTTLPSQSERLAEGIPGAQLRWVPGAGHMLNWEAVDEMVESIEVLSGTPSR